MIKKTRFLLGLAALLTATYSLPVQAGYNCGIKIQKLEQQLGYAKAYGNTNRVRGLQRALANVKARCGVDSRPATPAISTLPATPSTTLPATPSQTHAQAWREIEISKQALAVEKLEIELQQALNEGNVQQAAYQGMLLEHAEAALAALRAQ